MTKDAKIPKTHTTSGVWSTEEMDHATNDPTSKFASMSATHEEIWSAIVGDGNHSNIEGNNHGNRRFRPNNEGFFENYERDQSPK